MSIPEDDLTVVNLDNGSDIPARARYDLRDDVHKMQDLLAETRNRHTFITKAFDQNISQSPAWTQIAWHTVIYDDFGAFNPGAKTRLTLNKAARRVLVQMNINTVGHFDDSITNFRLLKDNIISYTGAGKYRVTGGETFHVISAVLEVVQGSTLILEVQTSFTTTDVRGGNNTWVSIRGIM